VLPQLAQAEISSTASAMPLARAHKVEQAKQVKKQKKTGVIASCGRKKFRPLTF
jgi:hypothetical protein